MRKRTKIQALLRKCAVAARPISMFSLNIKIFQFGLAAMSRGTDGKMSEEITMTVHSTSQPAHRTINHERLPMADYSPFRQPFAPRKNPADEA